MKTDIILAGVGGQGILSIAAILGAAALNKNLYLKQAETHGMSQRGGAVVSHLRISDKPVWSDLIPSGAADLILSVEPLEALRYLPYLKQDGAIVTNNTKFENVDVYPDIEVEYQKLKDEIKVIRIDADNISKLSGNTKASNMVMIGAALQFTGFNEDDIIGAISAIFGRKGESIVNSNIAAFKAGKKFAEEN